MTRLRATIQPGVGISYCDSCRTRVVVPVPFPDHTLPPTPVEQSLSAPQGRDSLPITAHQQSAFNSPAACSRCQVLSSDGPKDPAWDSLQSLSVAVTKRGRRVRNDGGIQTRPTRKSARQDTPGQRLSGCDGTRGSLPYIQARRPQLKQLDLNAPPEGGLASA
ncbi:hypothetical protein MPH_10327 [Macrophomina phaseolina MS6]|uniref:Uncharacterized protein n=1 Tax=Macrophomina phaseolina (strain MS6) TaxID=1126212 RepID=K2RI77_MACPH|nr:hypothetical protein MPH_10327 [Macrophomina phaseolina MS6]